MSDISVKDNYIKELSDDLRYSTGKFDGQTLAISGAALGFTLTFIKEIVPFTESLFIWLLYAAQALFILSITLSFISHYLSMNGTVNNIVLADADQFQEIIKYNKRRNVWINGINRLIVWALPIGILILVLYCFLNVENLRGKNESKKKFSVEKQLENGGHISIDGDLKKFEYVDTASTKMKIKIN